MGQLIFGQESFSFEQIRTYVPAETTADQNRASVLLFCHEWLNGKDSFTLHTSGSTGAPKPIKLTRLQMELSAAATGQALSLTRGDKALVCLNTSYIAGIMMLVRGMVLDLDLILVPPVSSPLSLLPDPVQLDFAAFVPLQLEMLLQDDQHRAILNQMKAIIVGGAPVSRELEQKLDIALKELPQQCRTIFQMSRFEELKYREIADQLGLSVKTVENQMGKALRLLRVKLADFLPVVLTLLFTNQ